MSEDSSAAERELQAGKRWISVQNFLDDVRKKIRLAETARWRRRSSLRSE